MLTVRFRFGVEHLFLGDDSYQWTKELFEYRQAETPRLLVEIKFPDGRTTKTFLHNLQLVEEPV